MKQLLTAFILWGFANGVYAADILTSWGNPGVTVDGFKITHNLNGTQLDDVTVGADDRDYTYLDVASGIHMFTIVAFIGEIDSQPPSAAGALLTDALTITIEVK
jgi:hypothetical protein